MEKKYSTICPLNQREANAKRLREAITNDMKDLSKKLLNYSKRFLYNSFDREDLVCKYLSKMMDGKAKQFKYIINDSKKITKNDKFMRWTYIILRNLCMSYLMSNMHTKETNFTYFENPIEEERHNSFERTLKQKIYESPEQEAIKKETIRRLGKSLQMLDKKHRDLILRFHIKGLKYREIADKLNIPIGTVKSGLARAEKKLGEIILRDEENFLL